MSAELTPEDIHKLAEQLKSLPGGVSAAIPDFFAPHLEDGLPPLSSNWDLETWEMKAGGLLCLRVDPNYQRLRLIHVTELRGEDDNEEIQIVNVPESLLGIAREHGISPLLLTLLCVATGQADDGRRLKVGAPKIDAAAKDLMLMTVCRLCG